MGAAWVMLGVMDKPLASALKRQFGVKRRQLIWRQAQGRAVAQVGALYFSLEGEQVQVWTGRTWTAVRSLFELGHALAESGQIHAPLALD